MWIPTVARRSFMRLHRNRKLSSEARILLEQRHVRREALPLGSCRKLHQQERRHRFPLDFLTLGRGKSSLEVPLDLSSRKRGLLRWRRGKNEAALVQSTEPRMADATRRAGVG